MLHCFSEIHATSTQTGLGSHSGPWGKTTVLTTLGLQKLLWYCIKLCPKVDCPFMSNSFCGILWCPGVVHWDLHWPNQCYMFYWFIMIYGIKNKLSINTIKKDFYGTVSTSMFRTLDPMSVYWNVAVPNHVLTLLYVFLMLYRGLTDVREYGKYIQCDQTMLQELLQTCGFDTTSGAAVTLNLIKYK